MASCGQGPAMSPAVGKLQELEPRVARRRLSQARHRATLVMLFNDLRKIVYSKSDLTSSKWQVLNKAKDYIQGLEQMLGNLLKLKESFNLNDENAKSLEEIKEEYARMYSGDNSLILENFPQNDSFLLCPPETGGKEEAEEEDEEEQDEEEEEEEEEKKIDLTASPVATSPELLEFERYLNFYKQTMDLLTWNGIISSQEVLLPIVSAAISRLWQILPEESKACLLQAWTQKHSSLAEAGLESTYAEDSMKDSGVDSQGASCSLASTPEEILFEDAFDVANFLDKNEIPSTLSSSSMYAYFNPDNTQEKFQLYMQIIDFFKELGSGNTQVKEESVDDEEMIMLKCMETFDDEDL
ncbi:stimulated by retinoic acid gene 8 protein homolog [Perognathus longimembris pacificus]|uniref:stimulated by retinoic acid gene 8 protein homolog n=1 Tax=Perognathus longimembris pacificus TaxID=214514 RepID=UPI0020185A81|nr:stimulated by retinoic acid gene 8 protein homolog [Perognathus longimembris pacificus]